MRANPYSLELNYKFQDRRGLSNFTVLFDEVLNNLDLILYLWSDFIKFV